MIALFAGYMHNDEIVKLKKQSEMDEKRLEDLELSTSLQEKRIAELQKMLNRSGIVMIHHPNHKTINWI